MSIKHIQRTLGTALIVVGLSLAIVVSVQAATYSGSAIVAPDCSSAYLDMDIDGGGVDTVRVEAYAEIVGSGSAAIFHQTTSSFIFIVSLPKPGGAEGCVASVRIFVNDTLVLDEFACAGTLCPPEIKSDHIPPPGALWLADVCERYDNGAFNANDQITFGTDIGDSLQVGAAYDGPWTEVASGGPTWVLTRSQLEALAASQGVGGYGDLWFVVDSPNGTSEPRLLSSMIADRIGRWGSDCEPVP